jgi:hypothetical protein
MASKKLPNFKNLNPAPAQEVEKELSQAADRRNRA